jgi:hypothetical protein
MNPKMVGFDVSAMSGMTLMFIREDEPKFDFAPAIMIFRLPNKHSTLINHNCHR